MKRQCAGGTQHKLTHELVACTATVGAGGPGGGRGVWRAGGGTHASPPTPLARTRARAAPVAAAAPTATAPTATAPTAAAPTAAASATAAPTAAPSAAAHAAAAPSAPLTHTPCRSLHSGGGSGYATSWGSCSSSAAPGSAPGHDVATRQLAAGADAAARAGEATTRTGDGRQAHIGGCMGEGAGGGGGGRGEGGPGRLTGQRFALASPPDPAEAHAPARAKCSSGAAGGAQPLGVSASEGKNAGGRMEGRGGTQTSDRRQLRPVLMTALKDVYPDPTEPTLRAHARAQQPATPHTPPRAPQPTRWGAQPARTFSPARTAARDITHSLARTAARAGAPAAPNPRAHAKPAHHARTHYCRNSGDGASRRSDGSCWHSACSSGRDWPESAGSAGVSCCLRGCLALGARSGGRARGTSAHAAIKLSRTRSRADRKKRPTSRPRPSAQTPRDGMSLTALPRAHGGLHWSHARGLQVRGARAGGGSENDAA